MADIELEIKIYRTLKGFKIYFKLRTFYYLSHPQLTSKLRAIILLQFGGTQPEASENKNTKKIFT